MKVGFKGLNSTLEDTGWPPPKLCTGPRLADPLKDGMTTLVDPLEGDVRIPLDQIPKECEGTLPLRQLKLGPSSRLTVVVPVEFGSRVVESVLDTASQVTVISDHLFKELDLPEVDTQPVYLRGAAREGKMRSRQVKNLPMTIGGKTYKWDMYVAPITDTVLLGLDFLEHYDCVIDLAHNVITLDGREVPCAIRKGANFPQPQCRILISSSMTIPANSMDLVSCALERSDDIVGELLVEPVLSDSKVQSLPTLVDGKSPLFLPVINTTGAPISMKAHRTFGYAVPLSSTAVMTNEEDPPVVRRHRISETPATDLPSHLRTLWTSSSEDLPEEQAIALAHLLEEFQDVFAQNDQDLGCTSIIHHRIDTGEAKPIKQRMRRTPIGFEQEEEKHLQAMLRNGIVRPSSSEWASPPVLIRKRDGSVRWCVDYRKLNEVTVKDVFPLPLIEECLDTLSGNVFFSTLDMASGYWQIEVEEADRPKTAFITKYGLYEHNRMAFGLCNAPATFQRAMQVIFHDLLWKKVLAYIDDIIVMGQDFASHLANLREVLQRLRTHHLKLKPRKCELFRRKVRFLGRVVSAEGVGVDPEKIEKVLQWPSPTCIKELQSFLGFVNYHREHIRNFAERASPLACLTGPKCDFIWAEEQQQSFEDLKQAVASAPVLGYPTAGGEFILDTDASDIAIGAELCQVQEGAERVLAFASYSLTPAQRNYCTTRKELLAVVRFTRHFRHYLLGRRFLIRTDHSSLSWLMRFRHPIGQLARWLEELSQFDMVVMHRAGAKHQNADALSRIPASCNCYDAGKTLEELPCGGCRHCRKIHEAWAKFEEDVDDVVPLATRALTVEDPQPQDSPSSDDAAGNATDLPYSLQEYRRKQLEDPDISSVLTWIEDDLSPSSAELWLRSPTVKHLWRHKESLVMDRGVLCYKWYTPNTVSPTESFHLCKVVPQSLVDEVLHLSHDIPLAGHFGADKTLAKIRQRFFWPSMSQDCASYVRSCPQCGRSKKSPRSRGALGQYHAGFPLERVHLDILGPFPPSKSGNVYILMVIDQFTKWLECYPLPSQTAEKVATAFVQEFVARFGCPLQVHTDQGTNFEGELFTAVCGLLRISKTRTTPYRPCSNGQVERMNRTLLQMIRCFLSEGQDTWDEHLALLAGAIRASPSGSTGFSPNMLMLGREVLSPADLLLYPPSSDSEVESPDYVKELRRKLLRVHEEARKRLKVSQDSQKRYYDLKQRTVEYQEGDLVYVLKAAHRAGQSRKLSPVWQGPLLVIKLVTPMLLVVRDQRKESVLHHDRLKPFRERVVPIWMRRLRQQFLQQGSLPAPRGRAPRSPPESDDALKDIRYLFDGPRDAPSNPPIPTRRGRVPVRPSHLLDYVCSR